MHKHCHKPHTLSYDEYFNISNRVLVCDYHKPCLHDHCHHDDGFVYPHDPCMHHPHHKHPHIHDEHVHIHHEFPKRPLMDVDGDGFVEANFIMKPF